MGVLAEETRKTWRSPSEFCFGAILPAERRGEPCELALLQQRLAVGFVCD